jgi:hypothetical protein
MLFQVPVNVYPYGLSGIRNEERKEAVPQRPEA